MRRHRGRSIGLSLAATAVLLMASASPAAAEYGFHEQYDYYVGSLGGTIQCGRLDTWFVTEDWGASGEARTEAWTWAKRDLYCLNSFALPAGWIGAQALIERQSDGAIVRNTGMLYTSSTSNVRYSGQPPGWVAYTGNFRGVTAHRVLIVGGWKDALKASSFFPIT